MIPKRASYSLYLLLSLLGHGLLALILLADSRLRFYREAVEIDLMQKPLISSAQLTDQMNGKASHLPRPKMKSAATKSKSVRPDLSRFGIASTASQWVESAVKEEGLSSADDNKKWQTGETFSTDQLSAFQGLSVEEVSFNKMLWKEIDQSIEESALLSEYNQTGKIYFQFEFDENGILNERTLSACGKSPVLKVFAAKAIRKALRNERQELKFPRGTSKFYGQFSWADINSCRSLRGIKKNYLSFCHYAEAKRKTFTAGEKTAAYLSALQYGFGAIEAIEQYNREQFRRDTNFDPFVNLQRDPDWNLPCRS